jgi:hypothetical protein
MLDPDSSEFDLPSPREAMQFAVMNARNGAHDDALAWVAIARELRQGVAAQQVVELTRYDCTDCSFASADSGRMAGHLFATGHAEATEGARAARTSPVDGPPHLTCVEVTARAAIIEGRREWMCSRDCPSDNPLGLSREQEAESFVGQMNDDLLDRLGRGLRGDESAPTGQLRVIPDVPRSYGCSLHGGVADNDGWIHCTPARCGHEPGGDREEAAVPPGDAEG